MICKILMLYASISNIFMEEWSSNPLPRFLIHIKTSTILDLQTLVCVPVYQTEYLSSRHDVRHEVSRQDRAEREDPVRVLREHVQLTSIQLLLHDQRHFEIVRHFSEQPRPLDGRRILMQFFDRNKCLAHPNSQQN